MPIQLTPSYSSLCRLNVLRQLNELSHLAKNLDAAKLPLGIRQRERGNIPRSTRPFDLLFTTVTAMHSNFNDLKKKTMDITANDFFRQQYFAINWDKEQMDKTIMSPNECIEMMEMYHKRKLKLLGIGSVVGSLPEADIFEDVICEIDNEYKVMTEYRILVEPDSEDDKKMRELF